ncbi:Receptor-type tyrosine-protein phosphatase S [Exaiptasia diaphana]|nr:Receptor-type tyrosine-protein phosphatase S [Exaiptasia diaphana]
MSTILKQTYWCFLLFAIVNMILPRTATTGETSCEDKSIGVEDMNIIPDGSFTASSTHHDRRFKPYFARIGETRGYGWSPSQPQQNRNQYLQIDLGAEYFVCAIATKVSSPKVTINTDETTLPSSKESSQTLTCTVIAASPSDIQWFRNSTMKIESATNGFLEVKFSSAQEIISTYECTRKDPKSRSVICKMNYTCRVMLAVNENTEAAEAMAQVAVNLNVPAKQDFKVYPYEKELWLRWRPKQSDDVGRITGYKINLDGNVSNVQPRKTQHTLPGLQAYTLYRVQMKAISVVGEGLWSDVKEVTTLASVPEGKPSDVSATPKSSKSIEVTWELIRWAKFNGPPTGFRITYTDARRFKTTKIVGNVKKTLLTNLKKWTEYSISVSMWNSRYHGTESDIATATTQEDEPEGKPSDVSATPKSSRSIEVTWKLPHWAKFNGPSTGFRITYTDARRIKKTKLVRNVRKAFLSDLKKWMRYSITVSMWNSKYYGTESNIATATTKEDEPEGKPSDVSATPKSSTSIEVTWKLPHWAKFNGPSTGFRITYTDARRIKKTKLVRNVRKAFLSDLKKWMRYSITVSMWNSKYYGTESNIATATTKEDEPEGKPSDVSATPKSSRSIEVAWKLSRWAKFNGPSTGFRITYTDARRIKKTKLVRNVRKTLLTNLNKWMTYSITVSMWNSRYYGTESNIATATTKEDVPEGRPSGVSATPKSSTSIEVTWKLSLIAFYYVIKLVPDIAPQGIEVTEQNKTTFIIAWQPLPRNKANGNIIKYKVVWALRHIGRAKRMAVGDTFTGTTKGTQFVLNGLRLCAKYEVRVAAATKIGLGPNATQDLTTSRPGEPHHLRPLTIRRAFIILIWEKPKGIKEDETNYTVHFKGSKPYWSEYRPPLKTKTQAGRQTTLKIDNLQPGTHYEFWVTALTVCGESNRSLTVTVETQVDKPHIAQQVTPLILKDSSNVTLWTFKPHNGPIR